MTGVLESGHEDAVCHRICVRFCTSSTSMATAFFSWVERVGGVRTMALVKSSAADWAMQKHQKDTMRYGWLNGTNCKELKALLGRIVICIWSNNLLPSEQVFHSLDKSQR